MSNKFHQISFKEIFSDCQDMFIDDVPSFFDLLEEHLDISSFIPDSFFSAFYRSLGRKRVYPLIGFLSTLILQKIFSIPTDSMLIIFLNMWLQKSMQQCKKKADVFLAGIASQFTAIVAHSMKCPKYIRSLKPLIA